VAVSGLKRAWEQMFSQSGLTVEAFIQVKGNLEDLLKKILKQTEMSDPGE